MSEKPKKRYTIRRTVHEFYTVEAICRWDAFNAIGDCEGPYDVKVVSEVIIQTEAMT